VDSPLASVSDMTNPTCLSCTSIMEEGYVPDLAHASTPTVPQWTEGPPQRSFWRGLELRNRERLPVATYRCPNCGLLQSYALPNQPLQPTSGGKR
jgi:predicted RNA-binding Zn-ribbon protein involved in translation (DUF1610 family)